MNNWQGIDSFLELLALDGPSGHEDAVAIWLSHWFKAAGLTVEQDALGNLIARRPAADPGDDRPPTVLIAAHMDEIGLMVSHIEAGGFLRFVPIGGVDPRTLPSAEVTVHGRKPLLGVIGSKPPHLSTPEERKEAAGTERMFIDLGLPESEVRGWVRPGDPVTIRRRPQRLLDDRIAAKSVDNRASVAAVFECIAQLSSHPLEVDVVFAATVQEEVGMRGAATAAYQIRPDLAVAVDVCHARSPGVSTERTMGMGDGPAIQFGPNIHPALFRSLTAATQAAGLPYQVLVAQGATGTDARVMQLCREGIPTAALGIPIRYMHTSVETVQYQDIRRTGQLLAGWLKSLNRSVVEGFLCYFDV
ncbi:MAG: M20/M25/M40 family metallo-hydrolase [Kyrpidia tusciae]|nr:M20/M25/M40 family metallo-hydrolase [Kyrpidia tusciae]MBE3552650.1 M20/M25/M40 family metallo-hydrolase [Kyrpidia tusciae]